MHSLMVISTTRVVAVVLMQRLCKTIPQADNRAVIEK